MNVNTTRPEPVNLEERLERKGHLWYAEKLVRTDDPVNFFNEGYRAAASGALMLQIKQWGVPVTLAEATDLLTSLVERIHNIDPTGRTANWPENRAQVIQRSE